MDGRSLIDLAEEQLERARGSSSGRSAVTIFGGHEHDMRQTVIALAEGRSLSEHESPGEASLQVLRGSVRLSVGEGGWSGETGDYLVIPPARHDLHATTDAVVLLTVALLIRLCKAGMTGAPVAAPAASAAVGIQPTHRISAKQAAASQAPSHAASRGRTPRRASRPLRPEEK